MLKKQQITTFFRLKVMTRLVVKSYYFHHHPPPPFQPQLDFYITRSAVVHIRYMDS
jgi:hypothetical protein